MYFLTSHLRPVVSEPLNGPKATLWKKKQEEKKGQQNLKGVLPVVEVYVHCFLIVHYLKYFFAAHVKL